MQDDTFEFDTILTMRCTSKRTFPTSHAANEAIRRGNLPRLKAYRCRRCLQFHLHTPFPPRKRRRKS